MGGSPFWQWIFFITVAPMPVAGWRYFLKAKNNAFDRMGYMAAVVVWLLFMNFVKNIYGLTPASLALGGVIGLVPAAGTYGLFAIVAFAIDALPQMPSRRAVRRQQPYSAPDDGGYGYDPSRFPPQGPARGPSQGAPQGPYGGEGYHAPGHGPQGSPRPHTPPRWGVVMIRLLTGENIDPNPKANERRTGQERAAKGRALIIPHIADEKYQAALRRWGLSDGCTLAEVRARYRELSKLQHPDSGGTDGLFQQLQDDFEILSKYAK